MKQKQFDELCVVYRIEYASPDRFNVYVDANVIGTDNVVSDKRSTWMIGLIEVRGTGVFLTLPSINNRYTYREPIRVRFNGYRHSKDSRRKMRIVGDHLRYLIAPKLDYMPDDEIQDLFEAILSQLIIKHVLES